MNEITGYLSSPGWWFSAIAVALLINLASAYSKPWLDQLLSKISIAWRERSSLEKQKFASQVALLVQSQQALANASEEEVRSRLRSILLFLIATLFLLGLAIVRGQHIVALVDYSPRWWAIRMVGGFSLLIWILGLVEHRAAMHQSALVRTARAALMRSNNNVS